jgi:hypothetical protein
MAGAVPSGSSGANAGPFRTDRKPPNSGGFFFASCYAIKVIGKFVLVAGLQQLKTTSARTLDLTLGCMQEFMTRR